MGGSCQAIIQNLLVFQIPPVHVEKIPLTTQSFSINGVEDGARLPIVMTHKFPLEFVGIARQKCRMPQVPRTTTTNTKKQVLESEELTCSFGASQL